MQKDLAADIELNLKKKARRRLVGAIALVLMLIILLPFLLKDRSQMISNDDVNISLEDENGTLVTEQVMEELPADFDSKVVPETTQQQVTKSAELTSQVVAEKQQNLETIAVEQTSKSEQNEALPKVQKTDSQVVVLPSKPEIKPEVVAKIPEPKATEIPEKKTSAAGGGKYYVQIGAFSDASKVKVLQSKMQALGYQSKTEKVKTDKGVLIRLKSETFSNRNEAAIALENMKDSGLTGMVVSQ